MSTINDSVSQQEKAPTTAPTVIEAGKVNSFIPPTRVETSRADVNEIVTALLTLHSEGELIEARCLKPGAKSLISDDVRKLAEFAAETNDGGRNAYHAVNPLSPEIKKQQASDDDVLRLRWLPYDIDPERASDVSATDEEKASARLLTDEVLSYWRKRGYKPVVIDSGNGYQVLVPCDLDTACDSLTDQLLKLHAATFNTADAHIDTSVANPSRILALPGTIKRKGENTAERPWRPVELLDAGSREKVLDEAALKAMLPPGALDALAKKPRKNYPEVHPDFDPDAFFEHYGITGEWDGDWFNVDHCPFAEYDHTAATNTAFFFDGKVFGFKCFSNSCGNPTIGAVIKKLNTPTGLKAKAPYLGPIWKADPSLPINSDWFTPGGNAHRLVSAHGQNFKYSFTDNKWWGWNGKLWLPNADAEIFRAAQQTVLGMYGDAAAIKDDEQRKKFVSWTKASDSPTQHKAMIEEARTALSAKTEDFDRNKYLLNLQNGTFDLRLGQLLPHSRENLITKISPITYNPEAKCPRFLQFMDETFSDQPDVIPFVQRSFGYSLSGLTDEQCFWLLIGDGRNGKSVLLSIMQYVIGDYGMLVPFEIFLAKSKHDVGKINPRDGMASLEGARFVRASEADEERRFSEATIKNITGEGRIRTARMYESDYEYEPEFKIWLSTNHQPVIRGLDDGIWRRIRRINFNQQVPSEKVDRRLLDKLKAEASGILNWALAGWSEYQKAGLAEPKAVEEALAGYRHSQNPLQAFIDHRCDITNPSAETPAETLREHYNSWPRKDRELDDRSFGKALNQLGYTSVRRGKGNVRVYQGISTRHEGGMVLDRDVAW